MYGTTTGCGIIKRNRKRNTQTEGGGLRGHFARYMYRAGTGIWWLIALPIMLFMYIGALPFYLVGLLARRLDE